MEMFVQKLKKDFTYQVIHN